MPPSSPRVSLMVPKLKVSESTHFYRHFDTKYGTVFTMVAQKGKAEETGKEK